MGMALCMEGVAPSVGGVGGSGDLALGRTSFATGSGGAAPSVCGGGGDGDLAYKRRSRGRLGGEHGCMFSFCAYTIY
jgi:hypothetical protein